jgi:hypothetical protein
VSDASEPCTAFASIDEAKSARIVPCAAFLRIGRAHQVAVFRDRVLAFEDLHEHGPEIMNSTRSLKERALAMHCIEAFGFGAREMLHARSDDLQSGGFEAGQDLPDRILLDCVRLDDRQGAFNGHCNFPERLLS